MKIKRKILPGIPNSNRVDRAKAVPKLPPIIPANKYIKPIKVCIVVFDKWNHTWFWYIVQYSNLILFVFDLQLILDILIPEHAPKIYGKSVLTLTICISISSSNYSLSSKVWKYIIVINGNIPIDQLMILPEHRYNNREKHE